MLKKLVFATQQLFTLYFLKNYLWILDKNNLYERE